MRTVIRGLIADAAKAEEEADDDDDGEGEEASGDEATEAVAALKLGDGAKQPASAPAAKGGRSRKK